MSVTVISGTDIPDNNDRPNDATDSNDGSLTVNSSDVLNAVTDAAVNAAVAENASDRAQSAEETATSAAQSAGTSATIADEASITAAESAVIATQAAAIVIEAVEAQQQSAQLPSEDIAPVEPPKNDDPPKVTHWWFKKWGKA